MQNSSTIASWSNPAPPKSLSEEIQKHVNYAENLYMAWRKKNPAVTNILVFKHILLGYLTRVLVIEGNFMEALERIDTFWEEYEFNYLQLWEEKYQESLKPVI